MYKRFSISKDEADFTEPVKRTRQTRWSEKPQELVRHQQQAFILWLYRRMVNPSDCLSEDCGFESHQSRYRSSRIPDYMSCRGKAKRQNDSAEHAGARNGMQPIRMRKEMIVMKKQKQKCRKPK